MEQTACLLIHGVAGGRYQVERLKKHLTGCGIYAEAITVKGHEATKKELIDSRYYEWLADVNQKYLALAAKYSKIVVIGFSMGGLLGLNLAKRHDPAALVLVNCPIHYVNLPEVCRSIGSDLKKRNLKNIRRYFSPDYIPLRTLLEFQKLLDHTKRQLPEVVCPALILQYKDDDVVVPKSADYLHEHIGSRNKQLRYYDKGGHHIFLEEGDAPIYDDIASYIAELSRVDNLQKLVK